MNCKRCGKWSGSHAILPGQLTDSLCLCEPEDVPLSSEATNDMVPPSLVTATSEEEIAIWAVAARGSFGRLRRDYNFAICDALAAAGITPTAGKVLRIGKWGASISVQADTNDWYKSLAGRLKNLESQIPMAARRQANILFEQLFAVARFAADETTAAAIAPLEARIAKEIEAQGVLADNLQAAIEMSNSLTTQVSQLNQSNQILTRDLEVLSTALHRTEVDLTQARALLASNRERAEKDIASLHERTIREQAAAQEALMRVTNEARDEQRQLMLKLDTERQESKKAIDLYQAENLKVRTELELTNKFTRTLEIDLASLKVTVVGLNQTIQTNTVQFKERLAVFESNEVKLKPMMDLLKLAKFGGISLIVNENDLPKAKEWLQGNFSLGAEMLTQAVENFSIVQAEMPIEDNVKPGKAKHE